MTGHHRPAETTHGDHQQGSASTAPKFVPSAALGLDIGATKLSAAVVDQRGTQLSFQSVSTPHGIGTTAESLWRTVADLMRTAVRRAGEVTLVGIGVGINAPFDRARGTVSPLSLPEWSSFPLRERILGLYPDQPVHMTSDAVCEVVGEHWAGAGQGVRNMLGIVSAMAVGGALIQDQRLTAWPAGNTSGWLFQRPDAVVRSVAATSLAALSTVARGPEIASHAWSLGWKPSRTSEPLGVAGAVDAAHDAEHGNPAAIAAFQRAGRAMGESVAQALTEVPLDAVLVTGGVAKSGELLLAPMRAALREAAGDAADRVRILERSLGDRAGAVGAAALVLHSDRYYGVSEDSVRASTAVSAQDSAAASPELVAA